MLICSEVILCFSVLLFFRFSVNCNTKRICRHIRFLFFFSHNPYNPIHCVYGLMELLHNLQIILSFPAPIQLSLPMAKFRLTFSDAYHIIMQIYQLPPIDVFSCNLQYVPRVITFPATIHIIRPFFILHRTYIFCTRPKLSVSLHFGDL